MDRQEGYYWVKYDGIFTIAKYFNEVEEWRIVGIRTVKTDEDFEHINEVRIKQPGEFPD